jgi:hypothetical protein
MTNKEKGNLIHPTFGLKYNDLISDKEKEECIAYHQYINEDIDYNYEVYMNLEEKDLAFKKYIEENKENKKNIR